MTVHQWKDHKIEVSTQTVAKHLWGSIRVSVRVDDKELFQSSANLRIKDTVHFNVHDDNRTIDGSVVTIPPSAAIITRYKLIVDGVEVETGKVTAGNWYMIYGLILLLWLGILALLYFT